MRICTTLHTLLDLIDDAQSEQYLSSFFQVLRQDSRTPVRNHIGWLMNRFVLRFQSRLFPIIFGYVLKLTSGCSVSCVLQGANSVLNTYFSKLNDLSIPYYEVYAIMSILMNCHKHLDAENRSAVCQQVRLRVTYDRVRRRLADIKSRSYLIVSCGVQLATLS